MKPIYVVNLYNAPAGCARAGEAVTAVLGATTLTHQRTLLAGDCNLHHEDWDARTKNPTPQAQGFAEWVTNNGAQYGLDIGSVTHRQGGTLDLVIASRLLAQYLIECYTEDSLDTTSDHKAIITTIHLGTLGPTGPQALKFQFKKLDDRVFTSVLQAQTDMIAAKLTVAKESPVHSDARKESLDICASAILSAIHQSLTLSTPRIQNSGKGEPWWNAKCQDAVQRLKNCRRENILERAVGIENPAAKERVKKLQARLRKQVKQAKKSHYQ